MDPLDNSNIAKEKRKAIIILLYFILIFSYCILSVILYTSPIRYSLENRISDYKFIRTYPWYPPWRLAFLSLAYWLISVILYSFEVKEAIYMLWIFSILFLIFHTISLLNYPKKTVLYPLVYLVVSDSGFYDLHLDLAQVTLLVTVIASKPWRKIKLFHK
ncbi:MAG: hypothetical protein B6U94_05600 [Thermofilum sp. ex4484_79]|nr:MAG: hypothetical protein B6U94_05600 [Thermofilum sp. ex4484_79]